MSLLLHEMRELVENRSLEDMVELLDLSDKTVNRMGHLVEAVLDYTRLIGLPAVSEKVDLGALVEDVLTALRADIQAAGAEVLCDPLPLVIGDAAHLSLYVQNMIENAIKYRDPARPLVVELTAKSAGKSVDLTVSDNGIGIAAERQKTVFELFKRLHAFSDIEGNGLGLAVCQRIASMHQTSIKLVSSPGKGAAFTMKLPLA